MYPSTPRIPRIVTQKSKMFGLLALWLVVSMPLHAEPFTTCEDALTLPLAHSVTDYTTAKTPKRYAIEVERSGFLVVEARGIAPVPLTVRFLGRDCTETASNLPIPAIQGRHLHQVKGPDTYFVEIAPESHARSYEIDAWWVRDASGDNLPNKEEMAESDEFGGFPNKEEMAESDEFGGFPNKEEMAESDELGGSLPAWQEIAGHGLLEIVSTPSGLETSFHSLCPWTRRLGLLATFTCAPRLRLDTNAVRTVELPTGTGSQLIGVTLAASGLLAIEAVDAPVGASVVFDAEGKPIGDLSDHVAWFEAGTYFFETSADSSPIRIYAEID